MPFDRIQVQTVDGVITICASCKKVRDESENWHLTKIDEADSVGFKLSHGLCPDCAEKLYPEYFSR